MAAKKKTKKSPSLVDKYERHRSDTQAEHAAVKAILVIMQPFTPSERERIRESVEDMLWSR